MLTWNETNGVQVENEKGVLYAEQTPDIGVIMTLHNPRIALNMAGVYQTEELQYILHNQSYARIKHGYFSPSIGSKKVLETIVASTGLHGESQYTITFLSEDTTYQYPLHSMEWQELMTYFAYLIETK